MPSQETQDKEYFSVYRFQGATLKEPTESDPVVTTLYDKQTAQGGRVELEVEYEASNTVDIMWRRNGDNYVRFDGLWHHGKTSMVIKKADIDLHNNNRYAVIITDYRGRKCSTSAKVFVNY